VAPHATQGSASAAAIQTVHFSLTTRII
jgi:hypothetical protein